MAAPLGCWRSGLRSWAAGRPQTRVTARSPSLPTSGRSPLRPVRIAANAELWFSVSVRGDQRTAATPEAPRELVAQLQRRVRRATAIATTAGALDIFLAVGFVIPVFYSQNLSNRTGLVNGPLTVVVLPVLFLFGNRFGDRRFEVVRQWLLAECPADEAVAAVALRLPLMVATINATLWLAGAVLFGIFNSILVSPTFGALVASIIFSGGLTTSALVFLLAERIDRPITARALVVLPAPDPRGPAIGARLVAAWTLGTGVPLLGALVIGIVGATKPDTHPAYVGGAVAFLVALALSAGLLALLFAARSIAEPIAAVRRGLEDVESGELQTRVGVDDASEVGLLQAGFNRMAAGLEERERMRDLFGRHVGRDVAAAALGAEVKLGGEEREIATLFIDIAGSTALATRRPPGEVVALLNRFFAVVVEVVEANGGLVNKFEGDAALCVFGAPVAREDAADDALRAASQLVDRLGSAVGELDFAIGVSAGVAVAGNVGAEERYEYTVIGDPVNEAARLCELAKGRPGRVLASGRALDGATSEAARWRRDGSVKLRGREAETELVIPAATPAPVGALDAL
jgi:adenylate cyclase